MKKLIMIAVTVATGLVSSASWANVGVRGYFRGNGTYVAPYIRSNPDGNPYNNFGSFSKVDARENESPFNPMTFTREVV